MQADESEDRSTPGRQKHVPIVSPSPRPRRSSNFINMATYQMSNLTSTLFEDTRPMINSSGRYLFRGMSPASKSSAPKALLSVEASTLTEAAMALKESYALVKLSPRFFLTRLNTLVAS
ncbi:unnamed protein product [Peronospora effusa]|nr:unnamed protein product [Peronospora effusa]